jgi:hypothetical protein
VRRMLSRGENSAASRWLKQLQEMEPEAPRTRSLQAQLDL